MSSRSGAALPNDPDTQLNGALAAPSLNQSNSILRTTPVTSASPVHFHRPGAASSAVWHCLQNNAGLEVDHNLSSKMSLGSCNSNKAFIAMRRISVICQQHRMTHWLITSKGGERESEKRTECSMKRQMRDLTSKVNSCKITFVCFTRKDPGAPGGDDMSSSFH